MDRTKHNFDILEHVLRGVHACADDDDLVIHDGVPRPLADHDLPEIRVFVRGRATEREA
jgi:hypothetical protein